LNIIFKYKEEVKMMRMNNKSIDNLDGGHKQTDADTPLSTKENNYEVNSAVANEYQTNFINRASK